MDYALVKHDDPILHEPVEDFDFANPPTDPIEFATVLVEEMLKGGGIGLSANQLGLPYRVFSIASDPCLVCYNPRVVAAGSETVLLDEGCLSFPGVSVKVRRPSFVRVRYYQPNGEVKTEKFSGMTARVFQHELDHLDGVTMLDRASCVQRDKARMQMKKLRRKEKAFG